MIDNGCLVQLPENELKSLGDITAIDVTSNLIVVGTSSGSICFYEVKNALSRLRAESVIRVAPPVGDKALQQPVTSTTFSPCMKYLAVGTRNGKVILFDSSEANAIKMIYSHDGHNGSEICRLCWSKTSQKLFSGCSIGLVLELNCASLSSWFPSAFNIASVFMIQTPYSTICDCGCPISHLDSSMAEIDRCGEVDLLVVSAGSKTLFFQLPVAPNVPRRYGDITQHSQAAKGKYKRTQKKDSKPSTMTSTCFLSSTDIDGNQTVIRANNIVMIKRGETSPEIIFFSVDGTVQQVFPLTGLVERIAFQSRDRRDAVMVAGDASVLHSRTSTDEDLSSNPGNCGWKRLLPFTDPQFKHILVALNDENKIFLINLQHMTFEPMGLNTYSSIRAFCVGNKRVLILQRYCGAKSDTVHLLSCVSPSALHIPFRLFPSTLHRAVGLYQRSFRSRGITWREAGNVKSRRQDLLMQSDADPEGMFRDSAEEEEGGDVVSLSGWAAATSRKSSSGGGTHNALKEALSTHPLLKPLAQQLSQLRISSSSSSRGYAGGSASSRRSIPDTLRKIRRTQQRCSGAARLIDEMFSEKLADVELQLRGLLEDADGELEKWAFNSTLRDLSDVMETSTVRSGELVIGPPAGGSELMNASEQSPTNSPGRRTKHATVKRTLDDVVMNGVMFLQGDGSSAHSLSKNAIEELESLRDAWKQAAVDTPQSLARKAQLQQVIAWSDLITSLQEALSESEDQTGRNSSPTNDSIYSIAAVAEPGSGSGSGSGSGGGDNADPAQSDPVEDLLGAVDAAIALSADVLANNAVGYTSTSSSSSLVDSVASTGAASSSPFQSQPQSPAQSPTRSSPTQQLQQQQQQQHSQNSSYPHSPNLLRSPSSLAIAVVLSVVEQQAPSPPAGAYDSALMQGGHGLPLELDSHRCAELLDVADVLIRATSTILEASALAAVAAAAAEQADHRGGLGSACASGPGSGGPGSPLGLQSVVDGARWYSKSDDDPLATPVSTSPHSDHTSVQSLSSSSLPASLASMASLIDGTNSNRSSTVSARDEEYSADESNSSHASYDADMFEAKDPKAVQKVPKPLSRGDFRSLAGSASGLGSKSPDKVSSGDAAEDREESEQQLSWLKDSDESWLETWWDKAAFIAPDLSARMLQRSQDRIKARIAKRLIEQGGMDDDSDAVDLESEGDPSVAATAAAAAAAAVVGGGGGGGGGGGTAIAASSGVIAAATGPRGGDSGLMGKAAKQNAGAKLAIRTLASTDDGSLFKRREVDPDDYDDYDDDHFGEEEDANDGGDYGRAVKRRSNSYGHQRADLGLGVGLGAGGRQRDKHLKNCYEVQLRAPQGLGINLTVMNEVLVVRAFNKLPDGRTGPAQDCGLIQRGDYLVGVNGLDLRQMGIEQAGLLLRNLDKNDEEPVTLLFRYGDLPPYDEDETEDSLADPFDDRDPLGDDFVGGDSNSFHGDGYDTSQYSSVAGSNRHHPLGGQEQGQVNEDGDEEVENILATIGEAFPMTRSVLEPLQELRRQQRRAFREGLSFGIALEAIYGMGEAGDGDGSGSGALVTTDMVQAEIRSRHCYPSAATVSCFGHHSDQAGLTRDLARDLWEWRAMVVAASQSGYFGSSKFSKSLRSVEDPGIYLETARLTWEPSLAKFVPYDSLRSKPPGPVAWEPFLGARFFRDAAGGLNTLSSINIATGKQLGDDRQAREAKIAAHQISANSLAPVKGTKVVVSREVERFMRTSHGLQPTSPSDGLLDAIFVDAPGTFGGCSLGGSEEADGDAILRRLISYLRAEATKPSGPELLRQQLIAAHYSTIYHDDDSANQQLEPQITELQFFLAMLPPKEATMHVVNVLRGCLKSGMLLADFVPVLDAWVRLIPPAQAGSGTLLIDRESMKTRYLKKELGLAPASAADLSGFLTAVQDLTTLYVAMKTCEEHVAVGRAGMQQSQLLLGAPGLRIVRLTLLPVVIVRKPFSHSLELQGGAIASAGVAVASAMRSSSREPASSSATLSPASSNSNSKPTPQPPSLVLSLSPSLKAAQDEAALRELLAAFSAFLHLDTMALLCEVRGFHSALPLVLDMAMADRDFTQAHMMLSDILKQSKSTSASSFLVRSRSGADFADHPPRRVHHDHDQSSTGSYKSARAVGSNRWGATSRSPRYADYPAPLSRPHEPPAAAASHGQGDSRVSPPPSSFSTLSHHFPPFGSLASSVGGGAIPTMDPRQLLSRVLSITGDDSDLVLCLFLRNLGSLFKKSTELAIEVSVQLFPLVVPMTVKRALLGDDHASMVPSVPVPDIRVRGQTEAQAGSAGASGDSAGRGGGGGGEEGGGGGGGEKTEEEEEAYVDSSSDAMDAWRSSARKIYYAYLSKLFFSKQRSLGVVVSREGQAAWAPSSSSSSSKRDEWQDFVGPVAIELAHVALFLACRDGREDAVAAGRKIETAAAANRTKMVSGSGPGQLTPPAPGSMGGFERNAINVASSMSQHQKPPDMRIRNVAVGAVVSRPATAPPGGVVALIAPAREVLSPLLPPLSPVVEAKIGTKGNKGKSFGDLAGADEAFALSKRVEDREMRETREGREGRVDWKEAVHGGSKRTQQTQMQETLAFGRQGEKGTQKEEEGGGGGGGSHMCPAARHPWRKEPTIHGMLVDQAMDASPYLQLVIEVFKLIQSSNSLATSRQAGHDGRKYLRSEEVDVLLVLCMHYRFYRGALVLCRACISVPASEYSGSEGTKDGTIGPRTAAEARGGIDQGLATSGAGRGISGGSSSSSSTSRWRELAVPRECAALATHLVANNVLLDVYLMQMLESFACQLTTCLGQLALSFRTDQNEDHDINVAGDMGVEQSDGGPGLPGYPASVHNRTNVRGIEALIGNSSQALVEILQLWSQLAPQPGGEATGCMHVSHSTTVSDPSVSCKIASVVKLTHQPPPDVRDRYRDHQKRMCDVLSLAFDNAVRFLCSSSTLNNQRNDEGNDDLDTGLDISEIMIRRLVSDCIVFILVASFGKTVAFELMADFETFVDALDVSSFQI